MCSDKIHQGGGVAAPVGGEIFSEILPYLEINQGNQDEIEVVEQIETPNIIGETIENAEKILKNSELILYINEEEINKTETIIKNQIPKAGITVNKGSNIYVEY